MTPEQAVIGRASFLAVHLTSELVLLALEVLAILAAAGVVAVLAGPRLPNRAVLRRLAAVAVGAFTLAVAFAGLQPAGAQLATDRDAPFRPFAGLGQCFIEDSSPERLAFAEWLRARMPARAHYTLLLSGYPDPSCVIFVLLPRLPALPGASAEYTVVMGAMTPAIAARIARRDPSVALYAPGLALATDAR